MYVVKKSLIIDEWKKRRFQQEKESRMIGKSKSANLGSMMALSFKRHLYKVELANAKSINNRSAKQMENNSESASVNNS